MHEVDGYCRHVETYLCRKNDGHLIRIVGPSFDRVSQWAAQGIPLKIVYGGIDRYFERYHRNGKRRRPVRIDFCEADVLDLFDAWRRAVGITSQRMPGDVAPPVEVSSSRESLPAHLERVVARLTQARANGSLGPDFDQLVDRIAAELDAVRGGRPRGEMRQAVIDRLAALDAELLDAARQSIDEPTHAALIRDAEADLAAFRLSMSRDAFDAACRAAADHLMRERLALPTVAFR